MELEYGVPFTAAPGRVLQGFIGRWELVFYSKDRLGVYLGNSYVLDVSRKDINILATSRGGEQIGIRQTGESEYVLFK